MNRHRGTLLVALIGIGTVLVPAEKSEAGLLDWVYCVFHPCRPCDPCAPACGAPTCPPVVQEGSYCNPCSPCATPCSPCAPCPVSYVRRTYLEPRTYLSPQTVLEPRPVYVRRHYWDPCSRCYKTLFETSTSYCRRSYCVPVTNYVQRSYLEPVSCVTPSCPTNTCPVGTPVGTPLSTPESTIEPTPFPPGASIDRTDQPAVGSTERRLVSPQPAARYPTAPYVPGRRYVQPTGAGA